jgi:hypothetical protein
MPRKTAASQHLRRLRKEVRELAVPLRDPEALREIVTELLDILIGLEEVNHDGHQSN